MLVLDFATWLAGPFGTSLLADMGARVIKIESPAGDDARHGLGGRARTFQGKESLAIDLKSEEGRAAVRRLVAQADAIMHNMRGDAAARLGIDYETARELNPGIIYLYAGSYGSTGPGAGRAAFHPMMGALSGGALRQLGRGNEPPAADVPLDEDARYEYSQRMIRSNEASPDITGALGVATALSLGLLHRQRTGRGQYIETTMLASNLLLCSEDAIRYAGKPDLPELDGDLQGHRRAQPAVPDGRRMAVRVHPDRTRMAAAMRHRRTAPNGSTIPGTGRPNRAAASTTSSSPNWRRRSKHGPPQSGSRHSPRSASRASAPTPARGTTSSCPTRRASATASW